MSIKIHEGFRLPFTTFAEIDAFCLRVAEESKTVLDEAVIADAADRMVHYIDSVAAGDVASSNNSPKVQLHLWATKEKDSEEKWKCSVTLFPLRGECTLGMPFYYPDQFREILTKQPEYAEYAYFDNTDRPQRVSVAKWKQRLKDWDDVLLRRSGIPAKEGFSRELYRPIFALTQSNERFLPYVPSFEQRIKTRIKHRAFEEYARRQGTTLQVGNFVSMMFDSAKWIKEDAEGKAWASEQRKILRKVLRRKIEPSDFSTAI